MKRLFRPMLILAALLSAAVLPVRAADTPVQKSLLWQVTSKTNTVYLFGTMHVGKANFYPLPDPVEKAFKESAKLVVEADVTNQSNMDSTLPLMMYTPPATIESQIPPEMIARLKTQLTKYRIPYDAVKTMKPFMVGGLLSVGEFTRLGYEQRWGVDGYFLEKALLSGKPIVELESVTEQMKMLSDLIPAEQRAFLGNAISALESGKATDQVTGMVNAWSIGDAKLLEEVVKTANEGMAMTEALDAKMLYGRNQKMFAQIDAMVNGDQKHFIAVGAMHLVGKRGLVEMLRAKGYEVKQL